MVSGGTTDRIAALTFSKVASAGSGTAARYSSTVAGAERFFAGGFSREVFLFMTDYKLIEWAILAKLARPGGNFDCLFAIASKISAFAKAAMARAVPRGPGSPGNEMRRWKYPAWNLSPPSPG